MNAPLPSPALPRQGDPHLLAIDLAGIVHRSFHACAAGGEPERAPATALRQIVRVLRGRQPTHLLLGAEGAGSVRRAFFPRYKADREPIPGMLACASSVEAALLGAGAPLVRAAGLEAEDVIAAAVRRAATVRIFGGDKLPVVILTQDKDLEQLVDDDRGVVCWNGLPPPHARVLDAAGVRARWGVGPDRLVELLALAGDRSDGIPGVPGWGAARAAALLQSPKPLATLIAPGGEWWAPKKFRAKLAAHREAIRIGLELARLRPESVCGLADADPES